MSDDVFALTPINLALDGSLELFVELYEYTYNLYLDEVRRTPTRIEHRDNLDAWALPQLIPAFELLAFRQLRIFTAKIKNIHLDPRHFKRFSFFHEGRIESFKRMRELDREWRNRGFSPMNPRFTGPDKEIFEFQETAITLEHFIKEFKRIVIRAIQEELQKNDPSYTIFAARRDVDGHIAQRMMGRRNDCMIPNQKSFPPTSEPLYIFDALNNTMCKREKHRIVVKKYYALHTDGQHTVAIPVHYCESCKRYMIGSRSLSLFREFCGKFIVNTKLLMPGTNQSWDILGESRLHQLGYNVVDGKLSALERQNILVGLLEGKQLSFFEMVATIEQNIRTFENHPKMQKAVSKWQCDLKFINEYALQHRVKKEK